MSAKTLMIMGTSSSVGKSLLTAALCRLYARRGMRVAPFKAQNMSNNAAVCPDGAEIGRAQALQAHAARIEPSADMNPVLLKPEGHTRSQVIVLGRHQSALESARYTDRKIALWPVVTAALERLRERHDLVIIEGAGSPVELNLLTSDIVNMAVARHAQSPVLLVGDIDKGGIFAQALGTLWLLPPEDRKRVRGLVLNKFRGDSELFADGVRLLEQRGETPVLGIVPYLADVGLPDEDAVALDERFHRVCDGLDIAVIKLPHIANFDDFDPLAAEPGVRVRYVDGAAAFGRPDAVILPGTKTTMRDLAWLCARGLDQAIGQAAAAGTAIVGICGGFQMLGRAIRDQAGVESSLESMPGLGLLPVETTFHHEKLTRQVSASLAAGAPAWCRHLIGERLSGYEIHMGRTSGTGGWLEIEGMATRRLDGAASPDGRIWGTYLHGVFVNDRFRHAWLGSLQRGRTAGRAYDLDAALDRLADAVGGALDMDRLDDIIGLRKAGNVT